MEADEVDICKACRGRVEPSQRVVTSEGEVCATCHEFGKRLTAKDVEFLRSMKIAA